MKQEGHPDGGHDAQHEYTRHNQTRQVFGLEFELQERVFQGQSALYCERHYDIGRYEAHKVPHKVDEAAAYVISVADVHQLEYVLARVVLVVVVGLGFGRLRRLELNTRLMYVVGVVDKVVDVGAQQVLEQMYEQVAAVGDRQYEQVNARRAFAEFFLQKHDHRERVAREADQDDEHGQEYVDFFRVQYDVVGVQLHAAQVEPMQYLRVVHDLL